MKSVIALTLAVFCLSMLIDFGDCRNSEGSRRDINGNQQIGGLQSNFDLLSSGIMEALQLLTRGVVTAESVAKFIINTLNVLMNAGLF